MKDLIAQKIEDLQKEMSALLKEREDTQDHLKQLEIRMHQVAGALAEVNDLYKKAISALHQAQPSNHPSASSDQDMHQQKQSETE
jgi:phage shock protein A